MKILEGKNLTVYSFLSNLNPTVTIVFVFHLSFYANSIDLLVLRGPVAKTRNSIKREVSAGLDR